MKHRPPIPSNVRLPDKSDNMASAPFNVGGSLPVPDDKDFVMKIPEKATCVTYENVDPRGVGQHSSGVTLTVIQIPKGFPSHQWEGYGVLVICDILCILIMTSFPVLWSG